ncbi:hypothetical protein PR048_011770 [Dryococelus australis]|uniref:Integrase zinc-binding domain-containing protein n=1 Tax=Dryococelus australis TaxID=614101 RepID=A0ABQ9HML1_9NEOP|nr:hypothetical protein PR048_011770 [Dryococelus australis]
MAGRRCQALVTKMKSGQGKNFMIVFYIPYRKAMQENRPVGIVKPQANNRKEFFWLDMDKHIANYVNSCKECQLAKQPHNSKVGMHLIVKMPKLMDCLSKFVIILPLRDMKATNIVKVLSAQV